MANILPSFLTPANFGDSATGVGSPADVDRRRKLAAALTENGISTAPVESWTQGAARLAQALAGNIQNKRALAEETAGRKSTAAALASAMAGETPDYQSLAANPWIDQNTVLQLPTYVRNQRQNSAVDKMLANVPEQDRAMAQAFPQQYIENKMKLEQMKAQMGMVDGMMGGGAQPSPDNTGAPGQIQQGPVAQPPPLNFAPNMQGAPQPQPGSQTQAQPIPQSGQAMAAPQIDLASIPIPPSVQQAARIAALQSPGDAAKIINDYRMKMAEMNHNDFYKTPSYVGAASQATEQGKNVAQRQMDQPEDKYAANNLISGMQDARSDIQRILGPAGKGEDGLGGNYGFQGMFPNMPGSNSSNAWADLNTLKSKIAFNVLQAMRQASKTGGALGQISDREEQMLTDNLSSLEHAQDQQHVVAALTRIDQYFAGAQSRIAGLYADKYGQGGGVSTPTAPGQAPEPLNGASLDALLKQYGH